MIKERYNWKNVMMLIVLVLMIISLSSGVFALGIAPTKKIVNFEPNLEKEISLKIINNEHKDFKAVVYVRGELSEYLSIENSLISIKANQEFTELKYQINLPEKMSKAGIHEAEVVLMEFDKEFGTEEYVAVNAVAAVISKIKVRVPYSGKYAESKVYVSGAKVNEDVLFTMPVFNFGKEDILKTKARIEILGATYEKIGETNTNEISITSKGEGKLIGRWKAEGINAGVYHAVVVVDYDGKKIRMEQNFEVGDLRVDIKEVKVEDFNLGEVAKFDIYVENMWNQLLEDVYGEIIVTGKDRTEHTRFKTASIDLDSYGTGKLEAYWSTKGVPIGAYDLDLTVFYEGKTTNKLIDANVNIDSITTEGVVGRVISAKGVVNRDTVLMFVLFILVVVNIGWFIYIKRRTIKN